MAKENNKAMVAGGSDAGAQPKAAPVGSAPEGKIEQVRDILFGAQLREIERRFRDVSERLESELAAVSRNTDKRLAEMGAMVESAVDRLQLLQRQEADDRGRAIEDLDGRVSQLLRTHRGEIMTRIEQIYADMTKTDARVRDSADRMNREMTEMLAELRSDMARSRDELEGGKISKRDFAGVLAELSMRLMDEGTPRMPD